MKHSDPNTTPAPPTNVDTTNSSPLEIGSIRRNRKGQFLAGSIPNPTGRPTGSRNRSSLLARALLEEKAAEITRRVMQDALDGNPIAYKLCFERLIHIPQDGPIDVPLAEPGSASAKATPERLFQNHNTLIQAVAEGEITPQEAHAVSQLFEARRRSWEALEVHKRLEQIEARLAEDAKH